MPDAWMGRLVGKMHVNGVSQKDLAEEMMCTDGYVSMLLNGTRRPDGARERLESAYARVMEKRKDAKTKNHR